LFDIYNSSAQLRHGSIITQSSTAAPSSPKRETSVKQERHIYAFSDADYAGDVTSRKSRTGVAVKLSAAIVARKYTRQKIVTLSTTEAEYVAASQNIKEFIWLKLLLSELGIFEDFK
jgi:hypothetical protein